MAKQGKIQQVHNWYNMPSVQRTPWNCRHFLLECTALKLPYSKHIRDYTVNHHGKLQWRPVEWSLYRQWHHSSASPWLHQVSSNSCCSKHQLERLSRRLCNAWLHILLPCMHALAALMNFALLVVNLWVSLELVLVSLVVVNLCGEPLLHIFLHLNLFSLELIISRLQIAPFHVMHLGNGINCHLKSEMLIPLPSSKDFWNLISLNLLMDSSCVSLYCAKAP